MLPCVISTRELCSAQSRKLDQLEEENVRLENQLEQKQLDWETRDVELEELQVIYRFRIINLISEI